MSNIDRAALIHDIEYVKGNQFKADNNMFKNMVKNDPMSLPHAVIVRAAFLVKDLFGYSPKESVEDYNHLKEIVLENKEYFGLKGYDFYD